MTTERIFEFDENTKLLKVEAITKDNFTQEQIKNIYSDLKARLEQADISLKKLEEQRFALNKIEKEPRTKDLIEIISSFVELKIPPMESVEKAIKYWKEAKENIEQDMRQLSSYVEIS